MLNVNEVMIEMRLKYIILLFLSVFLLSASLYGQQTSPSSLFMYNKYDHIPAYAGLEGSLFVTGNYRSQWQGLAGKPVTQDVNAHMPAYILKGSVGLNIKNRTQGPQAITDVQGSYSYVLSRGWGILASSVNVGFFQYRLDGSELRTPGGDYTDGNIDHNDLLLSENLNSAVGGSYGISVYYVSSFMEAGLAIQQIPSYLTNLKEGSYRNATNLKFYAEVPFTIYENYIVSPNLLVQSDLIQTQVDLTVTARYSGNVFGGIGVRGYSESTLDAVLLIAGWQFNKHYKLSYGFDIGVSALNSVHQGSHEIQLSYNLDKKIGMGLPPKIIYNPRYM